MAKTKSSIISFQFLHGSTAALMVNGEIKNVISQEKIDNIKNSTAPAYEAAEYMLKENSIEKPNIISVSGVNVYPHVLMLKPSRRNFRATHRTLYGMLEYRLWRNPISDFFFKIKYEKIAPSPKARKELETLLKKKFKAETVDFWLHHECHAYSPIMFYGEPEEEWLVFTADGSGDFYSATVWIWDPEERKLKNIAKTHWYHSLGYVYSKTTEVMGMKPLEHEYKVMGLAAYGKPEYYMETYEKIYKDVVKLDKNSLTFVARFPMNRFDYYLKDKVAYTRFDNLASALQHFTETLLVEWIDSAIEKTGINKVMTSGGVFMNVKANKKIQELSSVKEVRFMPSAGDESNPFGAAYLSHRKHFPDIPIKPVLHTYLGFEYTDEDVEKFIEVKGLKEKYRVSFHENIEEITAKLLSEGKVVARFWGKGEWGARALGNRSILADPSRFESFHEVNDQIKMRDFWMPFAPAILEEDAHLYIKNYEKFKNKVKPYYMITAFDTTELAKKHLIAAMHHGDFTIRPQLINKKLNPEFHKLVSIFKEMRGISAVLNTSLNIHGYPLVGTLEQALFTFENSGLKYMTLQHYLIAKKN